MADPTLTGRLLILLGNGATPTEAFAWPCGANARNVTFTNNLGEEVLLDCADPLDGGAWVQRWLESQDTQLTISGRLAKEHLATWRAWADGGTRKNVRIQIDESGANGGGYWTLPAFLSQFEMGREGSGQGSATFTATIMGAGERIWTAAA